MPATRLFSTRSASHSPGSGERNRTRKFPCVPTCSCGGLRPRRSDGARQGCGKRSEGHRTRWQSTTAGLKRGNDEPRSRRHRHAAHLGCSASSGHDRRSSVAASVRSTAATTPHYRTRWSGLPFKPDPGPPMISEKAPPRRRIGERLCLRCLPTKSATAWGL